MTIYLPCQKDLLDHAVIRSLCRVVFLETSMLRYLMIISANVCVRGVISWRNPFYWKQIALEKPKGYVRWHISLPRVIFLETSTLRYLSIISVLACVKGVILGDTMEKPMISEIDSPGETQGLCSFALVMFVPRVGEADTGLGG